MIYYQADNYWEKVGWIKCKDLKVLAVLGTKTKPGWGCHTVSSLRSLSLMLRDISCFGTETVALRLLQSGQWLVVTTQLSDVWRRYPGDLAFHLQVAQHQSADISRLQCAIHCSHAAGEAVCFLPVGTQSHARSHPGTQDSVPCRQIWVYTRLGECIVLSVQYCHQISVEQRQ